MGYVVERVDEDGHARYTAMYRDFHGRRRSAGTFSTRGAADKAALRAEVRIGEGWIADPRRGRQTLRHYVTKEWFPNHVIEAKTRENYTYLLNRYVLPELGDVRIAEILPGHVRDWVRRLQEVHEARPPTIRAAKVLLDAVFTTALNDQITVLHAGKGVKTPPVPKKPKTVITTEQFQQIYDQIDDPTMRLLVETDTETGLRWGELTELRVRDLDVATGIITVTRAVVELKAKGRPDGVRFLVKDYPKDREWRQVKIDTRLAQKVTKHIRDRSLSADDLLFAMPALATRHRRRPDVPPDLSTLGLTEPNEHGRRYRHGTTTAYGNGRCRCQYCRDAVAAYRASRRGRGKDQPRTPRTIDTDGHIPGIWFRKTIWYPALSAAHLGIHVRPHDLRHAHASWLLAGGADLQVVKERLGHASITTTEKYLHTLPGAHDSALAALAVIRGRTNGIETSSPANAHEIGDHAQGSRDDDLLELRSMVGKLSRMVAALSTP